MLTMSAWDPLQDDIARSGVALDAREWRALSKHFIACNYKVGDVILNRARVADRWLFVTSGIVASEQTTQGGNALIARFFEAGQMCSNLTSAWQQELTSDELIAITDVSGIAIPDVVFREQFLRGGAFGEYLRLKCMDTLLLDKEIVYVKTSNSTEAQYRFLERSFSEVIELTPQKDVARFMGLTPQGLNRFLKKRRTRSSGSDQSP